MDRLRHFALNTFRSQGVRSATLMTVGNITATGVSAVAMIIFSRFLGPVQFGVFSTLFSLLLILSKAGDLGLNIGLQRYIAGHAENDAGITRTVQTASYLKLIISLILVFLGLTTGAWLTTHVLNLSSDYLYLVVSVIVFSSTVILYEHINSILQGLKHFGLSVLSNLTQSAAKLALGLVLVATNSLSIITVTALYLLTPFLGALIGLFRIPLSSLKPRRHSQELKEITKVAKWTSIAIISATIADNLDVIIVQNFLTSYDTGLWSAAVRIATVASLIGWSLGTVLNVRVAAYRTRAHLNKYLKKASILALLSLVGISLLVFLSPLAIHLTVGPDFASATPSLNLLFISTALLAATSPFVALFYLFDRPQYFAYSGILGSLLLIGGDLVAIPIYGLVGAGYIRIISRLAVLLFTLYYARISYQKEYGQS